MADGREFFKAHIQQEFARKQEQQQNASAEFPRVERATPKARTFEPEWIDVVPGTPPPFETKSAAPTGTPNQAAVNPQAAAALFGALFGGDIQNLPQQLLRAASGVQQNNPSQLPPAPERQALPAGVEDTPAPEAPYEDEATVVDTRRSRRPRLPEGLKSYARHHKVISSLAIASMGITGGFGFYRVATGGTVASAVNSVKSDVIGVGDVEKVALPALDCKTPLVSLDLDGSGDMVLKMNAALVTDIEKAKKDKKFKLPTIPSSLPMMELSEVPLPETPEEIERAKNKVARYPKFVLRNEVKLVGCDKEKNAFRQEGDTVFVDKSKINLMPTMLGQDEKGAPKNAREKFEIVPMEITPKDTKYAPAPGEIDRLKAALTDKPSVEALQGEWRTAAYETINTGDCKLPARTESFEAIENKILKAAEDQGVSGIKVVPENDFVMPGESFTQGKAAALIDNKYVEIQNPQFKCTNVKLVGGAS